jgi:hypothetical protein
VRRRRNAVLTVAAAGVPPVLYLFFVAHYATNAFNSDDWSVVPLVHGALHGHLSLSLLWSQHNESRLLVGNIVDVLFGLADRLDLRSVIFASALLFIATYAGLLALVRTYLGRRLTPIPVLLTGVIWFSLADVQNALWAFQVSWYLTVFFFIAMLVVLLVPINHRPAWFALAVLLAIAASLCTVQGFLCWPLGAIVFIWMRAWTRRSVGQIVAWFGPMIVTIALYLPGYSFSEGNTCLVRSGCSSSAILHHPLTTLGFFIALIGNVIPGPLGTGTPVPHDIRFVLVGVALFAGAVYVLVQSVRRRASTERVPLPLLLISFALLFDVTITIGRGGTGIAGAVNGNRFVMANLILLTGLIVYTWAHVPPLPRPIAERRWRANVTYLVPIALVLFLIVQTVAATHFGLTNGRTSRITLTKQARVVVNLERGQTLDKERACQLFLAFIFVPPSSTIQYTVVDQLGEFRPYSVRYYRGIGLPAAPSACR